MRNPVVAVLAAFLAAVAAWLPARAQEFTPVLIKGHPAHPTRLLAKVATAPGGGASATAAALAANGLEAVRGFALLPGVVVLDEAPRAASTSAGGGGAAGPLDAAARAARLERRMDALRRSGLFEYVEPDFVVSLDAAPNDSAFTDGTLWGLRNTGQSGGTAGIDIDAIRAWDITTGSTDVIVAVIDTGVRYTHQDLAAQMWRNPREVAGNGIDDDGNGYVDDVFGIDAVKHTGDPFDDVGHGTHVAGTIGAAANNGKPHVGVAWKVRLMACKYDDANDQGTHSALIACYDYAVAHGANIFNCSFGTTSFSQSEYNALAAARDKGVLVVAAAGNNGRSSDITPHYPSSYDLDNIVSVAAINRYGSRANFSNYGAQSVDLGAPGESIYSTVQTSDAAYNTYDGTSMAAPHVAGVAALVRAQFPGIAAADLRDRIIYSSTPTASLQSSTASGGRVNAFNALTAVGNGQLKLSVSPTSGSALVNGRATPVVVRVRDLVGVTGASVVATVLSGGSITFLDDGVAPDVAANDSRYTAALNVPASGTQLSLSINATASGMTGANANVTYTLRPPPPNDNFADRIALPFDNGSTTANNFGGTLESGEPLIAGEIGGASVWWTWTPSADATATISTVGTGFDTLLGVYTGSSVSALTEIASNDDIDGPNQPSKVIFSAVAGTTYQIVVDGWEGKSGDIKLNVSAVLPPPVILNQPVDLAVTLGGSATLTIAATSFAGPSYQWRKDGVPINGATSPTFTILSTTENDAGFYDVVVSNGASPITSNAARLDVQPFAYPGSVRIRSGAVPSFELDRASLYAFAAAPDGKYYLGGEFIKTGGFARVNIVRFFSAGVTDTRYLPVVVQGGPVRAIALQPNSGLIIGGDFAAISDVARNRIARLDQNGSPDSTFDPGAGCDGSVLALALQPDGKVIVGGNFTQFNGVARKGLARLNADGALDSGFNPGAGFDGAVNVIVLQGDGKIVAGGAFTNYDGNSSNRIARLNSDGSLDLSFATGAGFDGAVNAVALQPDGRVLVGGGFTSFAGTGRARIARLLADGTLDGAFATGAGFDGPVLAIFLYTDGSIFVGGSFSTYDQRTSPGLVRLGGSGAFDPSFAVGTGFNGPVRSLGSSESGVLVAGGTFSKYGAQNTSCTARLFLTGLTAPFSGTAMHTAGVVRAAVPLAGGKWVAAGTFNSVNGQSAGVQGIARINADGTYDAAFTGQSGFTNPPSFAGADVFALAKQADGKIVAGGGFQSYRGITAARIARLSSDGSADTTFVTGSGFNGTVRTLAIQPDGRILAAGEFTTFNGAARSRLARLDRTGALDTGFNIGTGFNDAVTAILVQSDGQVLAAGAFTSFNGVARNRIARLNSNGSLDPTFDPGEGFDGLATVLAVRPDGGILVGGSFKKFGGVPGAGLAQLSRDGGLDVSFDTGSGFDGDVASLFVQADGRTLVGGSFARVNGAMSPLLTRLNVDGSRDTTFVVTGLRSGVPAGPVSFVTCTASGKIIVAGPRMDFSAPTLGELVVLETTAAPPAIVTQPVAQELTAGGSLGLSVGVAGEGPMIYQWYLNGASILGATSATYSQPSAQLFHRGIYSVTVTNLAGLAPSAAASVAVNSPLINDTRLLNLSTRGLSLTGSDVLIPGFVVSGSADKRVLMRVVGPTLGQFGVAGTLPDPRLTLKRQVNGAYQDFAANDDWGANTNAAEIASTSASLFAFALAGGSKDAALLLDVPPGQYTIVGDDAAGGTGVAIVELYDADDFAAVPPSLANRSRFANISNRGFVGTGGNIMIPGFVVSSEGAKTLLVRAVGPGLTQFGVSGVLADPQLAIYFRPFGGDTDMQILSQDNWSDNPDAAHTAIVASQVFAFPLASGSKDAAFVITLQPGIYTVHASGVGGTSGVALVEIYEVP